MDDPLLMLVAREHAWLVLNLIGQPRQAVAVSLRRGGRRAGRAGHRGTGRNPRRPILAFWDRLGSAAQHRHGQGAGRRPSRRVSRYQGQDVTRVCPTQTTRESFRSQLKQAQAKQGKGHGQLANALPHAGRSTMLEAKARLPTAPLYHAPSGGARGTIEADRRPSSWRSCRSNSLHSRRRYAAADSACRSGDVVHASDANGLVTINPDAADCVLFQWSPMTSSRTFSRQWGPAVACPSFAIARWRTATRYRELFFARQPIDLGHGAFPH